MVRPKLLKHQRLQLALTARRMVEQELAATPTPSLTETHIRVALRLGVTTRTLRTRLAEAPVIPTSKEFEAAFQAYESKWPMGKGLVTAEEWCEMDNLIDMVMRSSDWIINMLREID
jgi:hypothetical protein